MKVVLQAVIGSIAIHVIFIASMTVVGYIDTWNYKPNIDDTVVVLQDEVAFGQVISPVFGLLSIIGIAVILGLIMLLYKKFSNKDRKRAVSI